MSKKVFSILRLMHFICINNTTEMCAGITLGVIMLIILAINLPIVLAICLTPIAIALIALFIQSLDLKISFRKFLKGIKSYFSLNQFIAIMMGCLWIVLCAACM